MPWKIIGLSAAGLTMFSFIPQIIRVWRHKSARDVSPVTLLQLSSGVALWIVYGIYLKDEIVILANMVTLVTLIVLIFLYLKFGKQ